VEERQAVVVVGGEVQVDVGDVETCGDVQDLLTERGTEHGAEREREGEGRQQGAPAAVVLGSMVHGGSLPSVVTVLTAVEPCGGSPHVSLPWKPLCGAVAGLQGAPSRAATALVDACA